MKKVAVNISLSSVHTSIDNQGIHESTHDYYVLYIEKLKGETIARVSLTNDELNEISKELDLSINEINEE